MTPLFTCPTTASAFGSSQCLGDCLALLGIGLVVDRLRHDLRPEDAARSVPFVDGEVDRLTHFDPEGRRRRGQRSGDAYMDLLTREIAFPGCCAHHGGKQRRTAKQSEFAHS